MLKSISEIIKTREKDEGTGDCVAHPKKIRSPKSGKTFFVPGHVTDYIEQNGTTKTEFNADRYAEAHWNWRRERIKKREKKDVHFAAAEHPRIRTHKTDD